MAGNQLRIRPADPGAEREAIRAVLERNLPAAVAAGRHQWLYLDNPAGPARVWIAEDADGRAVGTSAAHPRRLRIDGEAALVLGLSDFAFDESYRTLGPALQLLRATLAPVRDGEFPLSYDLPSRAMAAIYRRMRGLDLGPMQRYALPLAAAPAIRRRFGEGVTGRLLGSAGDLALRARDAMRRRPRGLEPESGPAEFGPAFDAYDAEAAGRARVRAVRDAAYLGWRYGAHPTFAHELSRVHRGAQLAAWAVVRSVERGVGSVAEFEAVDADAARALVAELIERARRHGHALLTVQVLRDSPVARVLAESGFVGREEGPGPIVVAGAADAAEMLGDAGNWWLLEGDGDV